MPVPSRYLFPLFFVALFGTSTPFGPMLVFIIAFVVMTPLWTVMVVVMMVPSFPPNAYSITFPAVLCHSFILGQSFLEVFESHVWYLVVFVNDVLLPDVRQWVLNFKLSLNTEGAAWHV